jgi:outer membrane protein OmpA-like peptidoglycan-associated protein
MLRLVALALISVGCSKSVTFRGEQTLKVSAAPPAPVAEAPPKAELRENKIVIHEKVQFAWDSATILPVSFGLLDQVADVIRKNPQLKRIQVEGHASSEGDAAHNQQLSEDRARSVKRYLVEKGIPDPLLVPRGFGVERPIADNTTEQGREQNRRVEFNIVDQVAAQSI